MAGLGASLMPRTAAARASGAPWYSPRVGIASIMDQASLPGRAYASLGRMEDESYLDALGRTGPRYVVGQGEGDEMADAILRDPLTPVGLGLGSLLKGVRPVVGMASDLGSNAAGMAADQYATTGAVNGGEIGAGAGMGALLGLGGMAKGGKRSMISPEEREANLRNWFGDSKVVDADGKPLVVYHGTNADFNEFNPLQHFGTIRAAGDRLESTAGQSESVMPVYLRAKKILDVEDNGLQTPLEIAIAAKKAGAKINLSKVIEKYSNSISDEDLPGIAKRLGYIDANDVTRSEISDDLLSYASGGSVSDLMEKVSRYGDPREGDYFGNFSHAALELQDQLKKYDALRYVNDIEDAGSTSFIATNPKNVKSATGNRGTFDPNDPNITHFAGPASTTSRNRATTRLERQAAQVAYDKYGRPREESAARPVSAFQGLGSLLSSPSDTYYTRGGR